MQEVSGGKLARGSGMGFGQIPGSVQGQGRVINGAFDLGSLTRGMAWVWFKDDSVKIEG
jgi:hypothetical protein